MIEGGATRWARHCTIYFFESPFFGEGLDSDFGGVAGLLDESLDVLAAGLSAVGLASVAGFESPAGLESVLVLELPSAAFSPDLYESVR